MFSTGGTLEIASWDVNGQVRKIIYAAVTHGLFIGRGLRRQWDRKNSDSNTVPMPKEIDEKKIETRLSSPALCYGD